MSVVRSLYIRGTCWPEACRRRIQHAPLQCRALCRRVPSPAPAAEDVELGRSANKGRRRPTNFEP